MEIYNKLKEAEQQARETAERRSHEEVMAKAGKRLEEIVRNAQRFPEDLPKIQAA